MLVIKEPVWRLGAAGRWNLTLLHHVFSRDWNGLERFPLAETDGLIDCKEFFFFLKNNADIDSERMLSSGVTE